jgi:predicted negative regulator of RcsB-dependent stress response
VAKQLTRKELKTDKFVLEFKHGVELFSEHRQQIIRWGSVALGMIVVIVAVNMYRNYERGLRQDALHSAMEVQNSTVGGAQGNEFTISFPTAADRDKAVRKAFGDLAAKYPGTDESAIGEFFLGTNAADSGNLPEAEKHFKAVVDSGRGAYVSVAKLSLAQIYASEGKVADGEKLIQSVIDSPTVLVSKEEATIALGQLLQSSNPDRARKILEPLRTSTRPNVSKAALDAVAQLPPPKK